MFEILETINGQNIAVIVLFLIGMGALGYGWNSAKQVLSFSGLLMLLAAATLQLLTIQDDLLTIGFLVICSFLIIYTFIIRWKKRHNL